MTDPSNPYLGRTRIMPRPSATQAEFRAATPMQLASAQAGWDVAENLRRQEAANEADMFERASRYETREEPMSKAVENRMRVAFLSTKGATMKAWLEQRDQILATLAAPESHAP